MLEVYERLAVAEAGVETRALVLDHLQREKGRFKAKLEDGTEVRVFLERGNTLALGEILRSACGQYLEVSGAMEEIAVARSEDWEQFSRACYHLGNRHVKLQVGARWLRITRDHVLEEMLQKQGLEVSREESIFVPESGAYSGGGHGHHHH